jgi:hypothetical protein
MLLSTCEIIFAKYTYLSILIIKIVIAKELGHLSPNKVQNPSARLPSAHTHHHYICLSPL